MQIRWLGHASFLINSPSGRILTDPFEKKLGYPEFREPVDVVTVSHQHWDHNATHVISGNPTIISEPGEYRVGEVLIQGFTSFHDQVQGRQRGKNTIFKIIVDGLHIVHLGDLGHILTDQQITQINRVDILMLPVGGIFTIDAREAFIVVEQLHPLITIPMHFKTRHLSFELGPVERFTEQFNSIVKKPFLNVGESIADEQRGVIILDYLS